MLKTVCVAVGALAAGLLIVATAAPAACWPV